MKRRSNSPSQAVLLPEDQVFFHGTLNLDLIAQARAGTDVWIVPGERVTGSYSRYVDSPAQIPIPGRIYLTRSLSTARSYAGSFGEEEGAVLVIALPAGTSVFPDEDCVGEALQYANTEGGGRYICELDPGVVWSDPRLEAELREVFEKLPRNIREAYEIQQEPDGEYIAVAGKYAMRHGLLSEYALGKLVAESPNISVEGPLRPIGAYLGSGRSHYVALRNNPDLAKLKRRLMR